MPDPVNPVPSLTGKARHHVAVAQVPQLPHGRVPQIHALDGPELKPLVELQHTGELVDRADVLRGEGVLVEGDGELCAEG